MRKLPVIVLVLTAITLILDRLVAGATLAADDRWEFMEALWTDLQSSAASHRGLLAALTALTVLIALLIVLIGPWNRRRPANRPPADKPT